MIKFNQKQKLTLILSPVLAQICFYIIWHKHIGFLHIPYDAAGLHLLPIFIISLYAWIRREKSISLILSIVIELIVTWQFIKATMTLDLYNPKNYLSLAIYFWVSTVIVFLYIIFAEATYLIIRFRKK